MVSGGYDFLFRLFAQPEPGEPLGEIERLNVAVREGLFDTDLDFGPVAFDGSPRYMEVGVRPHVAPAAGLAGAGPTAGRNRGKVGLAGPPPGYVSLGPLIPLLGSPSSAYAALAATASTASSVTAGSINPVSLAGVSAAQSGVVSVSQGRFVVGPAASTSWELGGNSGTTGSDFLGTRDNQPLTVRVNQERAIWIQPTGVSPNLVGGFGGNTISNAPVGVTISGGGGTGGGEHLATASYTTIGGGFGNAVTNQYAAIVGGANNRAGGYAAFVGGGGGRDPQSGQVVANTANGAWSVVAGGRENVAGGTASAIGGGDYNQAGQDAATIAGGQYNSASQLGATVGGGGSNGAQALYATVSGGLENEARDPFSTVAGGSGNLALAPGATVGGGEINRAAGAYSTVGGGLEGLTTQYGQWAYASGSFGMPGSAQAALYVLRNTTSTNNPSAELFLDGAAMRPNVPAGRSMTFDVLIVARSDVSPSGQPSQSAGYLLRAVVKNDGNGAVFVGGQLPSVTVLAEDDPTWDVLPAVQGDSLVFRVNGPIGAGVTPPTIRWVARVEAVEVGW